MKDKKTKIELEKEEKVIIDIPDIKENNTPILKKALNSIQKTDNLLPAFTDNLLNQAKSLINSGLLPDNINKPEAVVAIMQKGKEMGFGPMASFEHIVVINGKSTLDGAALGTVLRLGGVEWEVIKNAEKQYVCDNEGKPIMYIVGKKDNKKTYKLPNEEQIKNGIELKPKINDVVTEIIFYRKSKLKKDGVITHTSQFTYKDAQTAELTGKDVWKKYLKSMLFWRCLSIGARQIAPDLTMGMITPEEADQSGKIWIDENGNTIKS